VEKHSEFFSQQWCRRERAVSPPNSQAAVGSVKVRAETGNT